MSPCCPLAACTWQDCLLWLPGTLPGAGVRAGPHISSIGDELAFQGAHPSLRPASGGPSAPPWWEQGLPDPLETTLGRQNPDRRQAQEAARAEADSSEQNWRGCRGDATPLKKRLEGWPDCLAMSEEVFPTASAASWPISQPRAPSLPPPGVPLLSVPFLQEAFLDC